MKIVLTKNILSGINKFLIDLKLSGKLSRARMKLIEAIDDVQMEMQNDIEVIRNENKDNEEEAKKLIDELLLEEAIIDLTKHERLINELYLHLDVLETEMDGVTGYVHDVLLSAIEEWQDKKEKGAKK